MQRTPKDSENVTIPDMVADLIEDRLMEMHVSFPAKITSVNGRRVTVRPIVNYTLEDLDGELKEDKLPEIRNVPVAFPGNSRAGFWFPVEAGDTGMCIVCDNSLDKWKESGDEGPPLHRERHGLNGAWFIPGILGGTSEPGFQGDGKPGIYGDDICIIANSSTIVDSPTIETSGSSVTMDASDIKLGSSGAFDAVALATKVLTELTNIITTFNTHEHVLDIPNAMADPPATPMVPAMPVGAMKVKAE